MENTLYLSRHPTVTLTKIVLKFPPVLILFYKLHSCILPFKVLTGNI